MCQPANKIVYIVYQICRVESMLKWPMAATEPRTPVSGFQQDRYRTLPLKPTTLPTHRFSPILLIQPLLQRREVIADGGGIHLALARQGIQRLLPGPALPHFEHRVEAPSCFAITVNRAAVQRILASRDLRQRAMELEL